MKFFRILVDTFLSKDKLSINGANVQNTDIIIQPSPSKTKSRDSKETFNP